MFGVVLQLELILLCLLCSGLSLTGSHLMCGDFLYSGHTVMCTLSYLFIKECEYAHHLLHHLIQLAVCCCCFIHNWNY